MYIFSWLDKKQIATTKPVNDDDDKCFQALNASPTSVVLNHEEVGKYSQKISQIETFRNKYDWKGITYQENMTGKSIRKIIQWLRFICYTLKKKYVSCLHLKVHLNPWKTSHSFNDSKRRRMTLSCIKKIICIIKRNNFKTCSVSIVFICLE